jgi:hypothetical protein
MSIQQQEHHRQQQQQQQQMLLLARQQQHSSTAAAAGAYPSSSSSRSHSAAHSGQISSMYVLHLSIYGRVCSHQRISISHLPLRWFDCLGAGMLLVRCRAPGQLRSELHSSLQRCRRRCCLSNSI